MESNSFISSYHLILTSETAKYLTVILRDEEKLLWQRNICQHDSLNCKELVDCPAFFLDWTCEIPVVEGENVSVCRVNAVQHEATQAELRPDELPVTWNCF